MVLVIELFGEPGGRHGTRHMLACVHKVRDNKIMFSGYVPDALAAEIYRYGMLIVYVVRLTDKGKRVAFLQTGDLLGEILHEHRPHHPGLQ